MKLFLSSSIFVLYCTQICLSQEWSDFKRRHILDPNTELYQNFKREDWNMWYRDHTENFGERTTENVLIGNADAILSLFDNGMSSWINGSDVNTEYFWSLKPSPLYVMKLNSTRNDYDVYNCLDIFYFVAKLDMLARPKHFLGYAEHIHDPITEETSQCRWVPGNSSNSLHSLSILSLIFFAILNIVSFQ